MGKGRRGRQYHSRQIEEKWLPESFPDQNPKTVNTNHLPDLENPSSSSSLVAVTSISLNEPTTSIPISEFIAKISNPVGVRPNRRGRTSKHRLVNAGPPNSSSADRRKEGKEEINELGSVRDSEEKVEEEEEKGGGHVSESKNDLNGETIKGTDSVQGDYVGRRFEQLQLAVAEPELSAEELRINDQLQEDELIAMESIYGDNVFIFDKQRDLRSFQIHIHAETSSELTIAAKLNSSSNLETKTDGSDQFSYSFKIQYLPPIVLTCVLPKSYPSHISPYFTVSVQWLDSGKISNLCCMLDSLWSEQPGQEVIYRWVEWLKSSCLSYLGFDKEIVLGRYGLRYTGDRRAISGSISPDVDIPSLQKYDDQQRQKNFCRNLHECCICISEFAGSEFVRLPCEHFFCWKCVRTFSDMHVKEGTINKLLCPNAQCGGMIPPCILKLLLGNEEFERWESLMLQKTLESMSDVVYCPRCETPCIEDEDQHTQCSKCFFSFCTLCREQRHVGTTCMTPELKLAILKERQNSSQLKDGQKRREQEMINEILSVREILRDAKQCPSCKMAISRIEGCNKMVCNNCGQYFCYRCNQAIDGYDHFRDGACDLFPQEAIQMWEERMMNARQVVGQIQAQLFADRGHPCPTCGQNNVKVGNNNHIFCWQCQSHYCYLCRKIVRRSSQHYGPKGCKQHSVG